MSSEPGLAPAVMEGKGSYNKHAKLQATGAALVMPLFEKAIREVELDSGDTPIVIADYGSSQRKNSLAPMRAAIRGFEGAYRSKSCHFSIPHRSTFQRLQYSVRSAGCGSWQIWSR